MLLPCHLLQMFRDYELKMQGIRSKWTKASCCCSAYLRIAWEAHPHQSDYLISSLGKKILFAASNYDCKSVISSYIALSLLSCCGCTVQPLLSSSSCFLLGSLATFPHALAFLASHTPTSSAPSYPVISLSPLHSSFLPPSRHSWIKIAFRHGFLLAFPPCVGKAHGKGGRVILNETVG